MKSFFSIVLLLIATAAVSGQDLAPQPFTVKWKPVAGAGGYLAEVKNSRGDIVIAQQAASDLTMLELHLVPGPYALRVTTLNRFLKPESDTGWLAFHVDAATAPVVGDSSVLSLHPGNTGTLNLPVTGLAEDATAALKSPSGKLFPIEMPAPVNGSIPLVLPSLSEKGAWSIVLSNPPSQTTTVTGRINVQDPDFMFIYPTIWGPSISFQDKTYGTGFGVDPVLVKQLKATELAAVLLDSYGTKILWGNLVFYSGVALSIDFGLGLPLCVVSTPVSGWGYEDLSRSVAAYNAPSDTKVTFSLKTFGYKLRWNNGDYDPHDTKILETLSADPGVKPFIDRYKSTSGGASFVGWASLALPVTGLALVVGSNGNLGAIAIALALGGLGALGWGVSTLQGASAEADLVQGVELYDRNH